MVKNQDGTRQAQSCKDSARDAVREFHAQVVQSEMALVLFFCSSEYDLPAVAEEMARLFKDVQVVGCTTAGEIGPAGYRNHSITGASFSRDHFTAVSGVLADLHQFQFRQGQSLTQNLVRELKGCATQGNIGNSFAFLLIDGLSMKEEPVARAIQNTLGQIPMVGGSAGDGRNFHKTQIYYDGRFRSDNAVLLLMSTAQPFKTFTTQHFVASDQRVVVTEADSKHRLVREIEGRPATEVYAELTGVGVGDLGPKRFAASPMVVVIGGASYVRSIGKADPDGSLKFFCAIDEGMVLRVGYGNNLLKNLEQNFRDIRTEIGEPTLVLGCDCILRQLEIIEGGLKEGVTDLLRRNNVVGFGTYGEQYRGAHVNQTFTGIAIGSA